MGYYLRIKICCSRLRHHFVTTLLRHIHVLVGAVPPATSAFSSLGVPQLEQSLAQRKADRLDTSEGRTVYYSCDVLFLGQLIYLNVQQRQQIGEKVSHFDP